MNFLLTFLIVLAIILAILFIARLAIFWFLFLVRLWVLKNKQGR